MTTIHFDGQEVSSGGGHSHDRVMVDGGNPVCLRHKSFLYLLRLAVAHINANGDGGWVRKEDIEPGENQIKYVYQLRQELGPWSNLIENDKAGKYRLNPECVVTFDHVALSHSWDAQVWGAVNKVIQGATN